MKTLALPTSEESWNAGRLALVFRKMCKFYTVSATFDNKTSTLYNAKTCLVVVVVVLPLLVYWAGYLVCVSDYVEWE